MYIEENVIGHIIMISVIFFIPWISYKIVQWDTPKKEGK